MRGSGVKRVNESEQRLRHMCLAVLAQPWSSLVLVPVGAGLSARGVLAAFAEAASTRQSGEVETILAEQVSSERASAIADRLRSATPLDRAVVALACPVSDNSAVAMAMAAEAAIVLVSLGGTRVHDARAVLEILGRDRVLGSVAVREGRRADVTSRGVDAPEQDGA